MRTEQEEVSPDSAARAAAAKLPPELVCRPRQASPSARFWGRILYSLVFLVLFALIAQPYARDTYNSLWLRHLGVAIEGMIVAVRDPLYEVSYKFQPFGGGPDFGSVYRRSEVSAGEYARLRAGDRVLVYYDADHPDHSILGIQTSAWHRSSHKVAESIGMAVCLALFALFTVTSLAYYFLDRHLLMHGLAVPAQVDVVGVRAGGRGGAWVKLAYTFTHPVSGEVINAIDEQWGPLGMTREAYATALCEPGGGSVHSLYPCEYACIPGATVRWVPLFLKRIR